MMTFILLYKVSNIHRFGLTVYFEWMIMALLIWIVLKYLNRKFTQPIFSIPHKLNKPFTDTSSSSVSSFIINEDDISNTNLKGFENSSDLSSDDIQSMYAKLETEDMAIEKFKTYVDKEFKNPLRHISHQLETLPGQEAKAIQKEVNALLNNIIAVDYLKHVNHHLETEHIAVDLEIFMTNIFNEIDIQLVAANIPFKLEKHTASMWVSMDVLSFKLFIQYIFTDLIKYSHQQNSFLIYYEITSNLLSIQIESQYPILNEYIYFIKHYSPYYQASKSLAKMLGIHMQIIENNENTCFKFHYAPEVIHAENELSERHDSISKPNDIAPNQAQPSILVWIKEADEDVIGQIIPSNDYNLILSNDKKDIKTAIKNHKINLLIIYNQKLNEDVYKITSKFHQKYPHIRILYISEEIDYHIEQQIIAIGIDDMVHLPIQNQYLLAKIDRMMANCEPKSSHRILQELYSQTMHDTIEHPNQVMIQNAIEIIQKRMNETDFNVKVMCQDLGITPIKCYRVFKEYLQISPSEFILKLKMQKAEHLLLNSSYNVAEIAYEIGFTDPKYFSKVFKKSYGLSPTKYKNQQLMR